MLVLWWCCPPARPRPPRFFLWAWFLLITLLSPYLDASDVYQLCHGLPTHVRGYNSLVQCLKESGRICGSRQKIFADCMKTGGHTACGFCSLKPQMSAITLKRTASNSKGGHEQWVGILSVWLDVVEFIRVVPFQNCSRCARKSKREMWGGLASK